MSASGSLERSGFDELGQILPFPAERSADVAAHLGLVDGLLRLSIGIESTEDLLRDLANGVKSLG